VSRISVPYLNATLNPGGFLKQGEVVAAVTGGKLDFGPREQIFYGEFDGGRRKLVLVKVIGE